MVQSSSTLQLKYQSLHMEHDDGIDQVARQPSASKLDIHGRELAPSRLVQSASSSPSWALGVEGRLGNETNFIDSESKDAGVNLEACRRSVNFQKDQYLRYLRKVRESGIEPRDLLSGLEIMESGPTAPPPDFWCLITVRDRLIFESNVLLEGIRLERKEALTSLGISGSLAFGLSGLHSLSIPWINILNIPTLSYGLYNAFRAAVTWHDVHKLESVVEQAINWELEDEE
ncbi:hypothetical protein EDB80DRAFT_694052 [Ilyonectria destructans]|nr:hypothetical protein EDB80DRAFT_694052 [Ilyonectria destructans]